MYGKGSLMLWHCFCQHVRESWRNLCLVQKSYKSMEVLALSVCSSVFTSASLTVYRPGSVAVANLFFSEFADALERCSTYTDCIVVGDGNIHLDCINSSVSQHFVSVLNSFGFVNRVHQPTHRHGRQLDVIITRSDRPSPEIQVDPPIMPDYSLFTSSVLAPQPIIQ